MFSAALLKLSPSNVQQVSIYWRKSQIKTMLSEYFSAIFTAWRKKHVVGVGRVQMQLINVPPKPFSLLVSMKPTKSLETHIFVFF